MDNSASLTARESTAINIVKAAAILSVISAHVSSVVKTDLLSEIFSTFWNMFGRVGVVAFFTIGGFLYSRKDGDNKGFFEKKLCRIIAPWVFCATLTYLLAIVLGRPLSVAEYLKWVLGSGTWYYYATIYTLFLFVFKLFYKNDLVLFGLIGLQTATLVLKTFNISTTIPAAFFTDYLNPLHWVGYFSAGILTRRYRVDKLIQNRISVLLISAAVSLIMLFVLHKQEIYTYFNILSSVFCVSSSVAIASAAYRIAEFKAAKHIGKIGGYSLCIFLLHMQIVQALATRIPDGLFKIMLAPIIGLCAMMILIAAGLWICRKLPFGNKIKMLFGL